MTLNHQSHQHPIPSFRDVGILTHIDFRNRETIDEKIVPLAQDLESSCLRIEQEYGCECEAAIVATDPFLPQELKDLNDRPQSNDWRGEIHVALANFPHVQTLTSDVISELVRTIGPLEIDPWRTLGSQSDVSTYQLPKVGMTLIRSANPDCRIVQFDEDNLTSSDDIALATIAVVEAARDQPDTILCVGYKPVYDPEQIG